MEIVERSKEGESLKFIRNLVNLKLHDPHQFRISISEVEQSQKSSMFQKIMQSIEALEKSKFISKAKKDTVTSFETAQW